MYLGPLFKLIQPVVVSQKFLDGSNGLQVLGQKGMRREERASGVVGRRRRRRERRRHGRGRDRHQGCRQGQHSGLCRGRRACLPSLGLDRRYLGRWGRGSEQHRQVRRNQGLQKLRDGGSVDGLWGTCPVRLGHPLRLQQPLPLYRLLHILAHVTCAYACRRRRHRCRHRRLRR